jgi:hypothetical protein
MVFCNERKVYMTQANEHGPEGKVRTPDPEPGASPGSDFNPLRIALERAERNPVAPLNERVFAVWPEGYATEDDNDTLRSYTGAKPPADMPRAPNFTER